MKRVRNLFVAFSLLGGSLVGCGDSSDGTPGTDGGLGADATTTVDAGPAMDPLYYVLHKLDVAKPAPGMDSIVAGFNIDGIVSDGTDQESCMKLDYTSPAPDNEMGVDNQLQLLISAVGDSFDVSGEIAAAIRDGSLVLLAEVSNVNSFTNDSSVDFALLLGCYPGTMAGSCDGMPMLDASMLVAPGQRINIDSRSLGAGMVPLIRLTGGSITNGRLRVGPGDLDLNLPFMDATLSLMIKRAEVRFDITATELARGVIGGALGVEQTIMTITSLSDELPPAIVRAVLEGNADLDFDMAMNKCRSVSVGLTFDGRTAMRGDIHTPTAP